MPGDYYPAGLQVDRESAREMISAITFASSLDQTAFAFTAERERKARKQAAAARKARLPDSDAASVSSFSSTMGLLKRKFSRRDKRASQPQSSDKTLRSQVNMIL